MADATAALTDTSDMKGVHQVFRDALAGAPTLVGSVRDGDAARAEHVGSYYLNVLALLHAHHEGEDELLMPKLVERCAPSEVAEVERIAAQHETVLSALGDAEAQVDAWRGAPSPASRDAAVESLGALHGELTEHLDAEERVVLPIAARHITPPEWGELPGHAMRLFSGDKLWLILGLVQEQMSPEQIALMEAHMPPPLLEFWQNTGRGLYGDYVSALRG